MKLEITVRPPDPRIKQPADSVEVVFKRVYDSHRSESSVERMTYADLEQLQTVVQRHLATV